MSEKAFQVGDRVRNRVSGEEGRIVRVYFDLKPSRKIRQTPNYIVALPADSTRPAHEVLWQVANMILIDHPEK